MVKFVVMQLAGFQPTAICPYVLSRATGTGRYEIPPVRSYPVKRVKHWRINWCRKLWPRHRCRRAPACMCVGGRPSAAVAPCHGLPVTYLRATMSTRYQARSSVVGGPPDLLFVREDSGSHHHPAEGRPIKLPGCRKAHSLHKLGVHLGKVRWWMELGGSHSISNMVLCSMLLSARAACGR